MSSIFDQQSDIDLTNIQTGLIIVIAVIVITIFIWCCVCCIYSLCTGGPGLDQMRSSMVSVYHSLSAGKRSNSSNVHSSQQLNDEVSQQTGVFSFIISGKKIKQFKCSFVATIK